MPKKLKGRYWTGVADFHDFDPKPKAAWAVKTPEIHAERFQPEQFRWGKGKFLDLKRDHKDFLKQQKKLQKSKQPGKHMVTAWVGESQGWVLSHKSHTSPSFRKKQGYSPYIPYTKQKAFLALRTYNRVEIATVRSVRTNKYFRKDFRNKAHDDQTVRTRLIKGVAQKITTQSLGNLTKVAPTKFYVNKARLNVQQAKKDMAAEIKKIRKGTQATVKRYFSGNKDFVLRVGTSQTKDVMNLFLGTSQASYKSTHIAIEGGKPITNVLSTYSKKLNRYVIHSKSQKEFVKLFNKSAKQLRKQILIGALLYGSEGQLADPSWSSKVSTVKVIGQSGKYRERLYSPSLVKEGNKLVLTDKVIGQEVTKIRSGNLLWSGAVLNNADRESLVLYGKYRQLKALENRRLRKAGVKVDLRTREYRIKKIHEITTEDIKKTTKWVQEAGERTRIRKEKKAQKLAEALQALRKKRARAKSQKQAAKRKLERAVRRAERILERELELVASAANPYGDPFSLSSEDLLDIDEAGQYGIFPGVDIREDDDDPELGYSESNGYEGGGEGDAADRIAAQNYVRKVKIQHGI